jgi:hypothetical protein
VMSVWWVILRPTENDNFNIPRHTASNGSLVANWLQIVSTRRKKSNQKIKNFGE